MNPSVCVAGLIAAALLCGCATRGYTAADLDGRVVCDEARMRAVERAAQRNFTEVRWVNCPTATLRVVKG